MIRHEKLPPSLICNVGEVPVPLGQTQDQRCGNLEYQTWLNFKIQNVGTEVEAFEHVLSSRMANNEKKKFLYSFYLKK